MASAVIRRWHSGTARGALAALVVSLVSAAFSAQAGRVRPAVAPPPLASPPAGFEAQDHFPGAALLYVEAQRNLPVPGATGTVELPDGPTPSDASAMADGSIRPAAPFALRGSELDKARALLCLTTAIYYEAANEPDDGQAAVAQVILNRVRHPTFSGTVCGVIYQGSDRSGCQFSFACDGAMARAPVKSVWDRSRRAAARALAGYVFAPVGVATHYHTYAVTPSWNRSLVMTGVFGAHFFHRWKGYWGTPAAFTQSYAGGEPLPGPHMRMDQPTVIAAAAPTTTTPATATPPGRTSLALVQPEHAASGAMQDAYAARADESQILDRWKDSGKPLR